jgi:(2Fe-2S) ferredoxin
MINILYNGRIIYNHIKEEDVNQILLELASDENINEESIEIEEI